MKWVPMYCALDCAIFLVTIFVAKLCRAPAQKQTKVPQAVSHIFHFFSACTLVRNPQGQKGTFVHGGSPLSLSFPWQKTLGDPFAPCRYPVTSRPLCQLSYA